MKKKRLLILATVVLAVTCGIWVKMRYYDPWREAIAYDEIMLAKFDAIQNGMTLAEVEALMGWPYDGQCGKDTDWPSDIGGWHVKGWNGPGTITVDVLLDENDGTVICKRYHPTDEGGSWDGSLADLQRLVRRILRW
jgi:hypothetical protein